MKDRLPLYLLITIPAAAVIMSSITMFFALSGPSQEIPLDDAPMSKTSWQGKTLEEEALKEETRLLEAIERDAAAEASR
ncbi:MAG: hypothetical protein AAGE43_13655 [Pseudomonadota bacterium]